MLKIQRNRNVRFWQSPGGLLCFVMIVLLFGCGPRSQQAARKQSNKRSDASIAISGAFALYPLTVKWAEEFRQLHPDVRIDISAGGAGKGMADALSGTVDLGMFSRAILPAEKEQGVWWIAVTKDAVLATMSAQNPAVDELKTKGLTKQQFMNLFLHAQQQSWGSLVGSPIRQHVTVYTRSDACGAAGTWAAFFGASQEDLAGIGVFGDPGLADAVRKDPCGIGYNNTIYIYNPKTDRKYEGLEVIPLDMNGNRRIDPEEDFYATMSDVMAAIASGKYPSPPARDLYFVARGKPQNPAVLTFLEWILDKGQQYVQLAGYVPLSPEVIQM